MSKVCLLGEFGASTSMHGHFVDTNKNALAKVIAKALIYVAPPVGFEPTTCPLGGDCAIQLCHGGVIK
ncbi:hypothetical protein TH15OA1_160016 [Vibrio harveyi]|nr:hypothetical protein TH15OA1_160016 [Vibrio harveyi]